MYSVYLNWNTSLTFNISDRKPWDQSNIKNPANAQFPSPLRTLPFERPSFRDSGQDGAFPATVASPAALFATHTSGVPENRECEGVWRIVFSLGFFCHKKRAVRSMANNCWHLGFLVRYGKMICFQCFFVEVCRPRFCWGQWPCSNYGTPAAGRRAPSGPWALLSRQGSSG